jgi:prephenate dehydrogenase
MLQSAYPDPETLHQLRVHLPDRPGVLAGITQALGAERINIEDFELKHASPERGGVLYMLVAGERQAERAAALLEEQGYGVVVSPVLDE